MNHVRVLPCRVPVENPHRPLPFLARTRSHFRVVQKLTRCRKQVGTFEDHRAARFKHPYPFAQYIRDLPAPKMLDDMYRKDFVDAAVLERGQLMQVAEDIGFEPAPARDHVDVDIPRQDLVAASEVKLLHKCRLMLDVHTTLSWNMLAQWRATVAGACSRSTWSCARCSRSSTSCGCVSAQRMPSPRSLPVQANSARSS